MKDYNRFARLLSASLYALSIQGRPMAIGVMTVQDAKILLRCGRVKARHFKTRSTYVYQMITVSTESAGLLTIYWKYIRPILRLKSPIKPNYFLLSYDGRNKLEVGRRVIEFFRGKLGLHITSNTLRSLAETVFYQMYMQGKIKNIFI